MALNVDTFTGGLFETNCFYLPSARLLVDAPEEAAGWLSSKGYAVESLLLTHGHIDHVWDAAQIQKQHACKVFYHRDTWPMISDPSFFKRYGMAWEVDPVAAGVEVGLSLLSGEKRAGFVRRGRAFRERGGAVGSPGRRPGPSVVRDPRKNSAPWR